MGKVRSIFIVVPYLAAIFELLVILIMMFERFGDKGGVIVTVLFGSGSVFIGVPLLIALFMLLIMLIVMLLVTTIRTVRELKVSGKSRDLRAVWYGALFLGLGLPSLLYGLLESRDPQLKRETLSALFVLSGFVAGCLICYWMYLRGL